MQKKREISLPDMPVFAKELKSLFKKPQALLLEGPLGAGKTTLVQHLLNEPALSPAFAVQNVYGVEPELIKHVDLYRLKDDQDLESTGFWDIFADPANTYLVIIEWADRLNPLSLPPGWHYLKVALSSIKGKKNTRAVTMEFLRPS